MAYERLLWTANLACVQRSSKPQGLLPAEYNVDVKFRQETSPLHLACYSLASEYA